MSARPPGFTIEDAQRVTREIESKLSPEERALLNQAGSKMRFWTNVGLVVGFMSFSLPITTRPAIRYRFFKGLLAGTIGVVACAPLGMLYGAARAQATIRTHPNHEHLLKVLSDTRKELMAGKEFGGSQSESEGDALWPSEQQKSSTSTSTNPIFDEDSLLTDDEIDRRNQGATFAPPNQSRVADGGDKPQTSWDALRARAGQQKLSPSPPSPPPPQKEDKNVWGEDK